MPRLALFSAALIWGSSFVMMKEAAGALPIHFLLACRFGISFLLLSPALIQRRKEIDRQYLKNISLIGFVLFLAYTFQTIGIRFTTPGKNAFLTAAYVILVPFVHWVAGKRKPAPKNLAAGCVCLAGIGLISLTAPGDGAPLFIGAGDGFTLLGAIFYAVHIVLLGMFTRGKDPVIITVLQFGYCTLYFSLAALLTESPPASLDPASLFNVAYLAVFCTTVAMLFQNYGQKYVNPSPASLIMSLEAVFGVIFSVILYHEVLTPRLLFGFGLVFGAILISEVPYDFPLGKQRSRSAGTPE